MSKTALHHYQQCWFIRAFEAAIAAQAEAGNVPGLVHLSTGSEVADVVLASHLDRSLDQVTGSHRSHGMALACGAEPLEVAKEILGRQGGLSDGLGGTQHLIAPKAGFLTSNGIVGAQVPLAAGVALSAKAHANGGIGIAVFGDGAANQGAVLETMNLAVTLKLPMLFVMYNNGIAQTTAASTATGGSFLARAESFGLEVWSADSADYADCVMVLEKAVQAARQGVAGCVDVSVTRDHGHYFGEEKGTEFQASPAMHMLEKYLLGQGVSLDVLVAAKSTARTDAAAVVAHAAAGVADD